MNIVYITTGNIYMNSSANIRNIALIKGLEELGIHVTVLTFENRKNRDSKFVRYLENTHVVVLGASKNQNQNMSESNIRGYFTSLKIIIGKKIKKYLSAFYRHVQVYDPYKQNVRYIKEKTLDWDNFDICITSSDPKSGHLVGYKLKKWNQNLRWVQYWGDPMTLDLTRESWIKPLIRKEERKLYRAGDLLVFTNKSSVESMEAKYPEYKGKINYIPTSFYSDNINSSCVKSMHHDDKLVIGYYGGCSSINRNIKPLVSTILKCQDWTFIQAGGNDIGLKTEKNLIFYDRISSEEVSRLTEKTDILVVIENLPQDKDNPCRQIPGKMYHYAFMGKPILVICETEIMKRDFGGYNSYYFCQNNEESISAEILKIQSEYKGLKFKPIEDFLPQVVATRMLKLVKDTYIRED